MYTLSPRASGLHIWQIPPAHVTTNTCNSYVCKLYFFLFLPKSVDVAADDDNVLFVVSEHVQ